MSEPTRAQRLRQFATQFVGDTRQLLLDAADALDELDQLQRRVQSDKRIAADRFREWSDKMGKLRAERDEAVEVVRELDKVYGTDGSPTCECSFCLLGRRAETLLSKGEPK